MKGGFLNKVIFYSFFLNNSLRASQVIMLFLHCSCPLLLCDRLSNVRDQTYGNKLGKSQQIDIMIYLECIKYCYVLWFFPVGRQEQSCLNLTFFNTSIFYCGKTAIPLVQFQSILVIFGCQPSQRGGIFLKPKHTAFWLIRARGLLLRTESKRQNNTIRPARNLCNPIK